MKSPQPSHAVPRAFLCAMLLPALVGCGMLTDALTRSASEMATQNAVKAIREVDLDRQVDITLIGGRTLNLGQGQVSRPVQTCVYVLQNPDWRPPPSQGTGECASRDRETAIIAVERRVVAPQQVQQFQLKAPGVREAWVMVDADFASRAADYLPLSLRIEGHGLVRVSAWLDGDAIFDGRLPRPARETTSGRRGDLPATASSRRAAPPPDAASASRANGSDAAARISAPVPATVPAPVPAPVPAGSVPVQTLQPPARPPLQPLTVSPPAWPVEPLGGGE